MSKREVKTKNSIEQKLSDAIVLSIDVLKSQENAQQQVHKTILNLRDKIPLDSKEISLCTDVLNAFLSLSFILIAQEEDIDKFIEYHNQ